MEDEIEVSVYDVYDVEDDGGRAYDLAVEEADDAVE